MLDLSHLRAAVRHEGCISRRLFLAYGAALAAIPYAGARAMSQVAKTASFSDDPFSLGVASGDPSHRGVVLWTRLAPEPLEGGGMPPEPVEVGWEVSADEGITKVVRQGTTFATPQLAHSVHVEVDGLEPDRWYWYRFHAGDATSPVGRTRTTPLPAALPEQLRFAFASCQHYEAGLYTCYEHMAKDELDLVFHLGDYIYEGPGKEGGVRKHAGPKLRSLADYRIRYGQYHSDPLLSRMHAQCPWVVTWDDHEVENDYAAAVSRDKQVDRVSFLEHRANAYQAYFEHMPLRRASLPRGPNLKLYRTVNFGRLASFQVLDTRQYRTPQPNDDELCELNDEVLSPQNTILGAPQAAWLRGALLQSPATWNVLAQQVLMAMVARVGQGPRKYSMDKWTGYAHERMGLIRFLAERGVPNPVVLTGDIHSNWVNDLRIDDRELESPVVATEFVGTAISSNGSAGREIKGLDSLLSSNPCVRFHNRQSGFVRCVVTPREWRSDFQVVENLSTPGGGAASAGVFVVESGKPGAHTA